MTNRETELSLDMLIFCLKSPVWAENSNLKGWQLSENQQAVRGLVNSSVFAPLVGCLELVVKFDKLTHVK